MYLTPAANRQCETPSRRRSGDFEYRSEKQELFDPPAIIGLHDEALFVYRSAYEILSEIQKIVVCPSSDAWTGKIALIGLSGGKTPKPIYEAMGNAYDTEFWKTIVWSKVFFFLIDERYVPLDHPDSNYRMIKESLFPAERCPIPPENFYHPDTSLPLEQCVRKYDMQLAELFRSSRPSMVILGLGQDGHIASWFPPIDFDKAYAPNTTVCHCEQTGSSAPVKDRITVSMETIVSSTRKLFLLSGEDKLATYRSLVCTPTWDTAKIQEQPLLQVMGGGNVTVVCFPSLVEDDISAVRSVWLKENIGCSFVVLGASGDLAVKKTFPALFSLYVTGQLPPNSRIFCYIRSRLTLDDLWSRMFNHLGALIKTLVGSDRRRSVCKAFLSLITIFQCKSYSDVESAKEFSKVLAASEKESSILRVFYLALPPDQFAGAVKALRTHCWLRSECQWTRVVVEKPFGRDSESATKLTEQLAEYAMESELYRIDHYLGKEMVLNLFSLRFANAFMSPLWNRHHVKAVRITFKETAGTEGRGGYFDRYGIIRDIIQNHLMQILALVAMERPVSISDEDVRDEKVKVLRSIKPAKLEDTVIGQYVNDPTVPDVPGYRDDPTVPDDSITPTFATLVLFVDNERWSGVPFILKAGKALESQLCEIRVQFQPVAGNIFPDSLPPNELVVRIQPNDAIYLKCMTKLPGLTTELVETELDLTVMNRFGLTRVNDAYERLILDVFKGDKKNFVRNDELAEAWRIFTPLLDALEEGQVAPEFYVAGSTGPASAYTLIQDHGFVRHTGYEWKTTSMIVPPVTSGSPIRASLAR